MAQPRKRKAPTFLDYISPGERYFFLLSFLFWAATVAVLHLSDWNDSHVFAYELMSLATYPAAIVFWTGFLLLGFGSLYRPPARLRPDFHPDDDDLNTGSSPAGDTLDNGGKVHLD